MLVKDNLVRGLPTKCFENDQTCVACLKGKQHRASCKSKVLNPITKPLFMLHMDLFGLTFVNSLIHKKYCLVVTDHYSKFTWDFFLTTKDETNEILKNFIKEIENLVDKKVKIIRSDNGTEFKNKVMDDFCREKGIKREYSVARTPQQNSVAEKRNRTLIEAARTMCHVTILNTLDSLGKFDGKSDEAQETRRVEKNSLIGFLENKPMIEGNGPKWLFDIDSLTQSMNYVPVAAGTIINESTDASYFDSLSNDVDNGEPKSATDDQKQVEDGLDNENDAKDKSDDDSSPKEVNDAGQHINTASPNITTVIDEPEVNLGNITNSYTVLTTPNTRIHKDHLIENVIGDVKSSVQTRRMTKPTSEQGQNPRALLKLYLIHLGGSNVGRTSTIQTPTDLDTCGFAYWKEGHWNKIAEILKKFNYTDVKSVLTPVEWKSLWSKMEMLMMLIFQVTPKTSHLLAVKRILRYLKGKPTLGLWYSRDSPFELVAYTYNDYAGATQDRKSTTGGCQFLGNRLISW
ncbi:putative ribonuclease H-like domain-containing protein [Tanacetum coccineum]